MKDETLNQMTEPSPAATLKFSIASGTTGPERLSSGR